MNTSYMKSIIYSITFLLITLYFTSCKVDEKPQKKSTEIKTEKQDVNNNDTLQSQSVSKKNIEKEFKQENIKIQPIKSETDDKEIVNSYVIHKEFHKEEDSYTIDFQYPLLNEKYNPKFEVFNTYVQKELIELPEIENNILEAQELLCDTLSTKPVRAHRIAEYKIYQQNEEHLSVLFYLENHYLHTKSAYYTFKTVNFDKIKGKLLNFEDYFLPGSTDEVLGIVNSEIKKKIDSGEFFYECFEVSPEDFENAKNDFVVNDDNIVFYFNDCVMCPSFVGTYSIQIPIDQFKPVLKVYWSDRFL